MCRKKTQLSPFQKAETYTDDFDYDKLIFEGCKRSCPTAQTDCKVVSSCYSCLQLFFNILSFLICQRFSLIWLHLQVQ